MAREARHAGETVLGGEGGASAFRQRLDQLLRRVARGELSVEEAADRLRDLPFADLGFAKVDHHRELRQGSCEIVLGEGKTAAEVTRIVERILAGNEGPVLVTRARPEHVAAVRRIAAAASLPVMERPRARALAIVRNLSNPVGRVLILTAGTSDLPVAEEASLVASVMGVTVELESDVGVAGLHRILAARERLDKADVAVVVAGMDAALASVVGGLSACPVIACPTSVGYGTSFGGLAALLSMLSSCAPGVVCVGIDDGVGAGYAAAVIARRTASGGR